MSSRAFGQLRGRAIIDYEKLSVNTTERQKEEKKRQYRGSRISFAFGAVTF